MYVCMSAASGQGCDGHMRSYCAISAVCADRGFSGGGLEVGRLMWTLPRMRPPAGEKDEGGLSGRAGVEMSCGGARPM